MAGSPGLQAVPEVFGAPPARVDAGGSGRRAGGPEHPEPSAGAPPCNGIPTRPSEWQLGPGRGDEVVLLASTLHPASAFGDERDWIARAASGDERAFRWLVERYQDQVYSVVLRMLRDPDLAAEATQDAFVKAFRGLDRFESRSRFSTWIYRIAVNVCYDRLGHKSRPADVALEDLAGQGLEPPAGQGWRAEDPLEDAEGRSAFEEALASLDDIYRLAFVLRQIEDRPYGEIAGVLGISETNAKVRVHRAREMMVTRLRAKGVL